MKPLRYVVLHHEGIPEPHFDFMFEIKSGSDLETLRVPQWPIQEGDAMLKLGAHRRDYLDYEGPVSGNRGYVRRVASGFCSVEMDDKAILVHLDSDEVLQIPRA